MAIQFPATPSDGDNFQGFTYNAAKKQWRRLAPVTGFTVEDEGTALNTAATTLNFTGDGVTASGTGTEKTINIPGGGDQLNTRVNELFGDIEALRDTTSDIIEEARTWTLTSGADTAFIRRSSRPNSVAAAAQLFNTPLHTITISSGSSGVFVIRLPEDDDIGNLRFNANPAIYTSSWARLATGTDASDRKYYTVLFQNRGSGNSTVRLEVHDTPHSWNGDLGATPIEQVQDAVDSMIVAGTNITKNYNDATGKLTLASTAARVANSFVRKGNWAAGQSYVVGDVVFHATKNWYCRTAHTSASGNSPEETNGSFWVAFASDTFVDNRIAEEVGDLIVAGKNITKTVANDGKVTLASSGGGEVTDESILDLAQKTRTTADRGKLLSVAADDEDDLVLAENFEPVLAEGQRNIKTLLDEITERSTATVFRNVGASDHYHFGIDDIQSDGSGGPADARTVFTPTHDYVGTTVNRGLRVPVLWVSVGDNPDNYRIQHIRGGSVIHTYRGSGHYWRAYEVGTNDRVVVAVGHYDTYFLASETSDAPISINIQQNDILRLQVGEGTEKIDIPETALSDGVRDKINNANSDQVNDLVHLTRNIVDVVQENTWRTADGTNATTESRILARTGSDRFTLPADTAFNSATAMVMPQVGVDASYVVRLAKDEDKSDYRLHVALGGQTQTLNSYITGNRWQKLERTSDQHITHNSSKELSIGSINGITGGITTTNGGSYVITITGTPVVRKALYFLPNGTRSSSTDVDLDDANTHPGDPWWDITSARLYVPDFNSGIVYVYNTTNNSLATTWTASQTGFGSEQLLSVTGTSTRIYLVGFGHELQSYNKSTKARVSSDDITLTTNDELNNIASIATDGTTIWLADSVTNDVKAVTLSTKARDSAKDLPSSHLRGAGITGITSLSVTKATANTGTFYAWQVGTDHHRAFDFNWNASTSTSASHDYYHAWDARIPLAGTVTVEEGHDALDTTIWDGEIRAGSSNIKFQVITDTAFTALTTKDPDVVYLRTA